MPRDSVWKPATSSPSASKIERRGSSRENEQMRKMKKGRTRYQWKIPQFGSGTASNAFQLARLRVHDAAQRQRARAQQHRDRAESQRQLVRDHLTADERSPPSSAYLLFGRPAAERWRRRQARHGEEQQQADALMSVTTNIGGGPTEITENVTIAGEHRENRRDVEDHLVGAGQDELPP